MDMNRQQQTAFTLIEILIVVAIMGVVAALIIPQLSPSINEQIRSSAHILVSDLDYARSLAISEGSTYKMEFDATENRYILTHSGTNTDLDTLPSAPFRNPNDPDDQHITDYDDLPHIGPVAKIVGAYTEDSSITVVNSVEFGSFGQTVAQTETFIWLSCSSGLDSKYVAIKINPITGIASVEEVTTIEPSALRVD